MEKYSSRIRKTTPVNSEKYSGKFGKILRPQKPGSWSQNNFFPTMLQRKYLQLQIKFRHYKKFKKKTFFSPKQWDVAQIHRRSCSNSQKEDVAQISILEHKQARKKNTQKKNSLWQKVEPGLSKQKENVCSKLQKEGTGFLG